jgi:DNA-binding HxlR family transcriptional regulator
MITALSPVWKTESNRELFGTLKSLEAECRNCAPITPFECLNRCQVYKLKNELRRLRETMSNPNYIKELFNALKNTTRLQILQAIVNQPCSINQLQLEIKKAGHLFNQEVLIEEYLRPLMAVGLATESRDEYCATMFGTRLSKMLGCFLEFADKLPAHSECYEETILPFLLSGPKTFEEIEATVPPTIVSRSLKRLHQVDLIETPDGRDYIFFFKSKRDPNQEKLTATERKTYDGIACEGSSAGKLSKETGLSMRVTYTYLRHLRGKKLVFIRRTPKTYGLTYKGKKLALVLQKLSQVVEDTWMSSEQVVQDTTGLLKVGDLS